MKRVTKQRRFGPGEFSSIAKQCMDVILKGENIFDFLASKGITDPVNEWYDIRRWIKSNAPDMYASIPMNLRLELPVQRVNKAQGKPQEAEAPVVEQKAPETPPAEEKRKPGRPAKAKAEENPIQERKPRKAPQKAKAKVTINEVQGQKITYTRKEGNIRLHVPGFAEYLIMNPAELRTMMSELPEVLKILVN